MVSLKKQVSMRQRKNSHIWSEIYMPLKTPLLPMELFKIRNFVVAVIVGSVGQMSFYALNILWPTHITDLYTTDNLKVGWMSVSNIYFPNRDMETRV